MAGALCEWREDSESARDENLKRVSENFDQEAAITGEDEQTYPAGHCPTLEPEEQGSLDDAITRVPTGRLSTAQTDEKEDTSQEDKCTRGTAQCYLEPAGR